jgi:DNA-binding response OmpR family regulator
MAKARILIVDDQAEVRAEVRERVESLGHEADEAACQEEALRKVSEVQYDCVLLDLGIPVRLEGVARVDHGKVLLQRIVALAGAPPVIVITSNGLEGHRVAVEMMKIGAKSFVAKPFDADPLEPEIQRILSGLKDEFTNPAPNSKPFSGGELVMNEDGIELCGVAVGGGRSGAIIRSVVQSLSIKKNGRYQKAAAKTLAKANNDLYLPASITAAISDFRNQCIHKLQGEGFRCTKDAVIETVKGGGYKLRDWIEVRLGNEEALTGQIEEDCALIMRLLSRHKKRTAKQLRESVTISPVRVKAAIAKLEARGKLNIIGGSGSTTTYEPVTL